MKGFISVRGRSLSAVHIQRCNRTGACIVCQEYTGDNTHSSTKIDSNI